MCSSDLGDQWRVFVAREGRVRARPVQIGHRNPFEVEITGGLDSGDLVVRHPTDKLADGVRIAARSDISEEVSRFRAHVSHWVTLADSAEPCGRKLDFLLQEMNREVNTMGSKADGLRVSELIIAAKAELEKMREQVQNVE